MVKQNVLVLFLFCVFPRIAVIQGHGCSFFRLSDQESSDRFMSSDLVPEPVKDFANFVMGTSEQNIPFGVYDCHDGNDEYEVGYSAAFIDNGTCMCIALYNFMECRSCELSCDADINNLDINSFRADCSNVKTDISQSCTVECDYTTYSCFVGDPKNPASSSATLLSSLDILTGALVSFSLLFSLLHV